MNISFKLNKYSKNVYSQYGEDGIIEYIIKTSIIPINKNSVEFGAHDGISNSNTYNLYLNHSFKSLLIETNNVHIDSIQSKYLEKDRVNVMNEHVTPRGNNSINNLIEKNALFSKENVGVLSIDIDSYDYYILKYLEFKPQIIIIEFNNSFPSHIDYVDPEGEVYLRCSPKAIESLANKKGYKVVCVTVTNCILLREDCFDANKHPNLPIEYLRDYEGMYKNNDHLFSIIHSQSYTTYPISTKPLNKLDTLYFKVSRFIMSLLKLRRERFIRPSKNIKKSLKKSGLYF